jgi:hypothetical protein
MLRALLGLTLGLWLLTPTVAQARDWRIEASVAGRYGFVPDALLDGMFDLHGTVQGFGPGLELGWTRDGFHALLNVEDLFVTTPDQVWLERDAENRDAKWVEVDMQLLSYGLIFAYELRLAGPVSLMPALGFVPLHLNGTMREYRTTGERDTPVEERTKDPDAKGEIIKLPLQFRSSDLGLRLRVQPQERWFLSLDTGWRVIFYTGLNAGVSF